MTGRGKFSRFLSIVLIISMVVSMVGCSSSPPTPTLSDPNGKIITENVITEDVITEEVLTEKTLTEFITTENYLEEIIIAEDKITEILLEEESISEVLLCKSIYVPQNNLEEFAENSQTTHLFGDGISIKSLLTKVAVGTGVIVTVVVLKKAGFSEPVASVVTAAADESMKFGASGAAIGSIFGGLTGATDELDTSGRTTALIGFATATAGLILSIVSLVAAVPSGGGSSMTLAAGVKLVIAGVSVLAATAGTAQAGINAVKTFKDTDGFEIDWDNIDWEKVGVSSAEKAINNGADGYMWGAIIGAVHGGADGYEFYEKHHTPYTQYNARLVQTPKNDEYGHWTGDRGESVYVYDKAKTVTIGDKTYEIKPGTQVTYKNCVPDFSPYQKAQVKIPQMTNNRHTKGGIKGNFEQADEALAQYWNKVKYNNKSWTARDVADYRSENGLTWHEMSNMESMQLVPSEINGGFPHCGGVAEYNAMIGSQEVDYFD